MTPYAKALWTALVEHQEAAKKAHPVGVHVVIPLYLITYGALIAKARIPLSPIGIGPYLREVAEECQRRSGKPLNALAVSQKSDGSPGVPGDSYDGAGGFLIRNWDRDVVDAIRSTYPLVP
jgi:hypothetical protein